MHNNQRQFYSSVLAVVFCGFFLLTGKLFVWPAPAAVLPDDPDSSYADTTEPPAPIGTDSADIGTTPTSTTSTSVSQSDTSDGSTESTTSETGTSASQSDTTASSAVTDSSAAQPVNTTPTAAAPVSTTASSTAPTTASTSAAPVESQPISSTAEAPAGYFSDALFIGDSRTVGLANYAPIEGADYFATVGLAAHKVANAKNEVGTKKNLSFAQLLASKTYGKIYIMLGINEIGMDQTKVMNNFRALIDQIRAAQPTAIIIIEANLRVAHSRSDKDSVVNNTHINAFNASLAQFADNVTVFYLDVNPLFDDGTGALGAQYTHDGTHPLAKYYVTWSQWLQTHAIVP